MSVPVIFVEAMLMSTIMLMALMFASIKNWPVKKFNSLTVVYIIFILGSIWDTGWYFFDGNTEYIWLNRIGNAIYLGAFSFVGALWFDYVCASLPAKYALKKRERPLLFILPTVIAVLALLSIKYNWIFGVGDDGKYFRGPLYLMQAIVSYLYILFASIISFYMSNKETNERMKLRYFSQAFFIIPSLAASMIQSFLPFGFSLTYFGTIISMFVVYKVETVDSTRSLTEDEFRKDVVVASLAKRYDFVAYIDVFTNSINVFRATGIFDNKFNKKIVNEHGFVTTAQFDAVIGSLVPDGQLEEFLKKVDRDALMERITKGEEVTVDVQLLENEIPKWFTIRFTLDENNGNVVVGFKIVDKSIRTQKIIEAISKEYECVNYVYITESNYNDVLIAYRVSDTLKRIVPNWDEVRNFHNRLDLLCETAVVEEDKEKFIKDTRRTKIISSLQKHDVYNVEFRVKDEGKEVYYQMSFHADYGLDHSVTGYILGIRNIDETVRRQIETTDALEKALIMAQDANRAKTAFLNNMSHDIRTPMNAIIGFTNLAQTHMDEPDVVGSYLRKISSSSEHLLSLVNDVLDMSRIESGKMSLNEAKENVPDIMNELFDIIQADIKKKNHALSTSINVKNANVMCDKLRLKQILLNLISNAIKYTPDNGSISISVNQDDNSVRGYGKYIFSIKDNGIGMTPEFVQTIFEPFARAKDVHNIQGTGLGMAITKNFIDMMGGKIEVLSEKDAGSEFIVTLDFRTLADDLKAAVLDDKTDYDFKGKKILLVDDNELNREIATEILTESGFIVRTADDGLAAVEKMKKSLPGDFDLILMDIQMPIMDGYEATVQIRKLPDVGSIPIIAMTANAFAEDRKAALERGMNDHIAKPIDVSILKRTISKYIF